MKETSAIRMAFSGQSFMNDSFIASVKLQIGPYRSRLISVNQKRTAEPIRLLNE